MNRAVNHVPPVQKRAQTRILVTCATGMRFVIGPRNPLIERDNKGWEGQSISSN